MKILLTTDWYAPAINGVVASVLLLRRELKAMGHSVRVLTLSPSRHSYREGEVTYLGSVPAGIVYPGARLRTSHGEDLVRELLDWGPEVIHSQCELSTFSLARRLAEELDVPLVHTYHTVYENYTHYFSPSVKWGRRAVAAFTRHIAARSSAMVAPTEKVAQILYRYGVSAPVYVVPSGIDLGRFEQEPDPGQRERMRDALGIPAENTVLLCLGRLAEEKNITELLDLLKKTPDDVTLLLVGDGPYREALETQVEERRLEGRVIFTGMVPPDQAPAYYHLADLFVSASTSETQGLTYAEALASGLPVLCRADPCLEGVIQTGSNGWQYRDEAAFQACLRAYRADPALGKTMSQAARACAQQFSPQTFATRIETIYRTQIARHQRRKRSA